MMSIQVVEPLVHFSFDLKFIFDLQSVIKFLLVDQNLSDSF